MPGVVIKKNTLIQAGTIVSKSTNENSLVYGNPQQQRKTLTKSLISKINNQNKNISIKF